ncbi:MAG: hypothetical protein GC158_10620 [Cyanobacteria bacterium RI_101]|nr:hypothetical protein [Cyanobacteria bacterium RI_101]
MYGLDVNFLKDRNLDPGKTLPTMTLTTPKASMREQLPIIIGAGAAGLLVALSGLSILAVNWQKGQTQTNIQALETELAQLKAQNAKIQELEAKAATIHQDSDALVGVFGQIKPWSALLQDLTDQMPQGVQISSIQQAGPTLTLNGFATGYDVLNDFLLTLQSSEFFQGDKTKLLTATTGALPVTAEGAVVESGEIKEGDEGETSGVRIPAGVKYTIETQITEKPNPELLNALIRKGASGLVARYKILEQAGVLKGPAAPPGAPPPILKPQEGAPPAPPPS